MNSLRASDEETLIKLKWPPLPEWKPNWLEKLIHNITRHTITFKKEAKNEYNQTSPEYVEGVIVLALHHICWIFPILIVLLLAQWSRFWYKPPGTLVNTLRTCICLCVSSILIVAAIQVFIFTLINRVPSVFSMHPQDNTEVTKLMAHLQPKINGIRDKLQAGYLRNLSEVSGDKVMEVIDPIDKINDAGDAMMSLYKEPRFKTEVISSLTIKLSEGSWLHFKIFLGLWILALICIFIAAILQPYFAGALCGITWCGIGAMMVTWVAVQLADACILPDNAIKSLPYDWTYKEMYSILKEYERTCKEYENEYAIKLASYRDRFEEAMDQINNINESVKYSISWQANNTRDYAMVMFNRVQGAAEDLMTGNLTLDCLYNSSSYNNYFPNDLPDYDRVIRTICEGARKLQLLVLQILILMIAPMICFLILVYAIITMKAATCPSAPCPSRRKMCHLGNKCRGIASCGPCSKPVTKSCSVTKQCRGPKQSSIKFPRQFFQKQKGCLDDQKLNGSTVCLNCNSMNMTCKSQPFSNIWKLSLSNPVSRSKIASGVGLNYCTALFQYTRQNCGRRDKSCDALFDSESLKVIGSGLNCSTSFSHTRLKLSSTHTLGSKYDLKARQDTSIQIGTEFKNALSSTISEIQHTDCIGKVNNQDKMNAVVPFGYTNSNPRHTGTTLFSTVDFRKEQNSKADALLYSIPKTATDLTGKVTNVCPFPATKSKSRYSIQKFSKSISVPFPVRNTESKKTFTMEIFEYNKTVYTSSTTFIIDQDIANDSNLLSSHDESKDSLPLVIQQIKSEPMLKSRCSKKKTRIIKARPINYNTNYCSQCRDTSFLNRISKTLISYDSKKHYKEPDERKCSDIPLQLHKSDCSSKPFQHVSISRPIPGIDFAHNPESKSNVFSTSPSMLEDTCYPTHAATIELKAPVELSSEIITKYNKLIPNESLSQNPICSRCKSNIVCRSRGNLCKANHPSSSVNFGLAPSPVSVVPVEPSSFAAQSLCNKPKYTR